MQNSDFFTEKNESHRPALEVLQGLGYQFVSASEALEMRGGARGVIFTEVLRQFLARQTFSYRGKEAPFSERSIGNAIRDLDVPLQNGLAAASKSIYETLLYGKSCEEDLFDGSKSSFNLQFVDWKHPERNFWHVTEEFSVENDAGKKGRPDLVILVNGIPWGVIECKEAAVSLEQAMVQLKNYSRPDGIPNLFKFVQVVVAAKMDEVRYGTAGTSPEFFAQWREQDLDWLESKQKKAIPNRKPNVQDEAFVSILAPERLLNLVKHYILFDNMTRKIARYQQYFAVENILRRIQGKDGEGTRNGVIWHTQGSGKSLTMVMLVKRILSDLSLSHYRFVLVCDRKNLVKQLRENFSKTGCAPIMATTGKGLVELLNSPQKAIITTTLQKFETSANSREKVKNSENIILLVDESHRSHKKGFHGNMIQTLPDAIKIGFTGTPLLRRDQDSTFRKFGPLIGEPYKFEHGIRDRVIVPLVYEGRMVRQRVLSSEEMDDLFERMADPLDEARKEYLKTKWSRFQKLAVTNGRLKMIAFDIHHHFKTYCEPKNFKAMVTASSRAAAIEIARLLNELGEIRAAALVCPENTKDGDDEGTLPNDDRTIIRDFFKNVVEPKFGQNFDKYEEWVRAGIDGGELDVVVVKDMLLTGFDAPSLGVLYVDKPLKEHTLLQAIARVNRIFPLKDFGLIVDYYGIFGSLTDALSLYEGEHAAAAGLDGFSDGDLDGSITSILAKAEELRESHRLLMGLFPEDLEGLSPSDVVTLFSEEESPDDAQHRRKEFFSRLKDFTKLMDLALGSYALCKSLGDEMLDFKADLKFCQKLRQILQMMYTENWVSTQYEAEIRSLLDTYVESQKIETKIEPVMIHDTQAMAAQLEELDGAKAKAAFIRTRLTATLELKRWEDPLSWRTFSNRIQDVLREYQESRDDAVYLQQMETLAEDYRQGLIGREYPACIARNNHAKAFYGILLDYLHPAEKGGDLDYDEELGRLAEKISLKIQGYIRSDWKNSIPIHKKMTQDIEDSVWDFADAHELVLSEDQLDALLEEVKKTAVYRF